MNEWKVSMARATLFPSTPTSFSNLSGFQLFHTVWGAEPDNFQKQENPLSPSVAQGRRGSIGFACAVHPSRLDFSFNPASPPNQAQSQIAVQLIENARPLRRSLLQLFDAIGTGGISDQVARVALNIQVMVVKPDFRTVNEAIVEVIPDRYGLRLDDEEDVVFQINRPYSSQRVQNMRMNAVTKWAGSRIQVITFSMPAGGTLNVANAASALLGSPQTKDFSGASVSFEVNSSPQNAPISSANHSLLLQEALAWIEQEQMKIGLIVEGLRNV